MQKCQISFKQIPNLTGFTVNITKYSKENSTLMTDQICGVGIKISQRALHPLVLEMRVNNER